MYYYYCVFTVRFTEGNPDSDCPPARAKDKGGREYKQKSVAASPQDIDCCIKCAASPPCSKYTTCGNGHTSACHLFTAEAVLGYSSQASANKAGLGGCSSAEWYDDSETPYPPVPLGTWEGTDAGQAPVPAPAGNFAAPISDSVSGGRGGKQGMRSPDSVTL